VGVLVLATDVIPAGTCKQQELTSKRNQVSKHDFTDAWRLLCVFLKVPIMVEIANERMDTALG